MDAFMDKTYARTPYQSRKRFQPLSKESVPLPVLKDQSSPTDQRRSGSGRVRYCHEYLIRKWRD